MNNESPLIFRIPEENIKAVGRKVLLHFLVIVLVFILILLLPYLTKKEDMSYLFLPACIGVGCIYIVYTMIRNNKKVMRSYTLTWDNQTVTRQVDYKADLELYHHEITRIEESPKGALLLIGRRENEVIVIPANIERRGELLALLKELRPIHPRTESYWQILIKQGK